MIDAFRLGGNHSQQWLTLLNLAELFARVGLEEAALTIVAANDANIGAARAHMEHGERLRAMLAEIEERLGPKACDRARERGQQMPLPDLVTFAFEQIDETLSRSTSA